MPNPTNCNRASLSLFYTSKFGIGTGISTMSLAMPRHVPRYADM